MMNTYTHEMSISAFIFLYIIKAYTGINYGPYPLYMAMPSYYGGHGEMSL